MQQRLFLFPATLHFTRLSTAVCGRKYRETLSSAVWMKVKSTINCSWILKQFWNVDSLGGVVFRKCFGGENEFGRAPRSWEKRRVSRGWISVFEQFLLRFDKDFSAPAGPTAGCDSSFSQRFVISNQNPLSWPRNDPSQKWKEQSTCNWSS